MVLKTDERNKLLKICNLLSELYKELETEFAGIGELLNAANIYGTAYLKKETARNHFKASMTQCSTINIKKILSEIEKIKEDACFEFTRGIDFCNMYSVILKEMHNSDFVLEIWRMEEELQYIIHGIRRIVNEKNENKKIAVLKGMMAYY